MGLDYVELIMEVERAFGVTIPDDVASRLVTVGDRYVVVVDQLARTRSLDERRRCRRCGYPLRELKHARCPECGQPYAMLQDLDNDRIWRELVGIIAEVSGMAVERIYAESWLFADLEMG